MGRPKKKRETCGLDEPTPTPWPVDSLPAQFEIMIFDLQEIKEMCMSRKNIMVYAEIPYPKTEDIIEDIRELEIKLYKAFGEAKKSYFRDVL